MSEDKLNFVVKFRKGTAELVNLIEDAQKEFKKCCRKSFKFLPQIVWKEPEFVRQDLHFEGDLWKISVVVDSRKVEQKHLLGKIRENICSHWCTRRAINFKPQYLIPTTVGCFHEKKPFQVDFETLEFAFGTLPDMCHYMQWYNYERKKNAEKGELLSSFYHNRKFFAVYMSTCNSNCKICLSQKFVVKYETINRVLINDPMPKDSSEVSSENSFIELFFQLSCPPFVYVERIDPHTLEFPEDSFQSISSPTEEIYQEKKWQRSLSFGCKCNGSYCTIQNIGKTPVLKIKLAWKLQQRKLIERLMHRCPSNVEFCYLSIKECMPQKSHQHVSRILREYENLPFLCSEPISSEMNVSKFMCDYAWKILLSRSLEVRDQVILQYESQKGSVSIDHWGFLKAYLLNCAKKSAAALSKALCHIADLINGCVVFTFDDALKQLFTHYHHLKSIDNDELPAGMCLIRRAIITPSRIIFLPKTEAFDNRVIRKFECAKEYMLRVSVQDDDFSKLTFAVQYHTSREDFMRNVVGNVLLTGMHIGNRCYEVLASSNSQLREHGLWLYAKDSEGRTAKHIWEWMGDFSHIKNVAKYMARMGQCFSTSDEALQVTVLQENEIKIPDRKTRCKKYTFSDGIGRISPTLADTIRKSKTENSNLQELGDMLAYKPSAFQIRYKGCKGMVAEDPTISGCVLAIRPSMEKFKCPNSNKLEIVKISAPRPLYLNRPLITILEQLHVNPDVFLELQKEMILDLTDALLYEDKAVDMLSNNLSLSIPFKQLRGEGICLTNEPFFRSLLLTLYKNAVGKLKSKARIAVPPKYGRNMLGVLDETGTLKYGQVFVQYSKRIGLSLSGTRIHEGTVVVTKNPCMHPGDVRKLTAVNVKALRHIKDCIVFPANGNRPHTDEMAGSDLDGDEYVVLWMPELIFPDNNFEPMLYPTSEERIHEGEIGVTEMVNFLCEYIQNDNIGTFANAHLSWADKLDKGIYSETCLKIAAKYPYVLDFAKTGRTERLVKEEKPKMYPDFMEKGCRSDSYRSKRVLGTLYRFVKNLEACVDKVSTVYRDVQIDECLLYPGWEQYKESARRQRDVFVERVTAILNKYEISEAEALCGCVTTDYNQKMKYGQDAYDSASLVKRCIIDVMKKFRLRFLKQVENDHDAKFSNDGKSTNQREFQIASAWYWVTYKDGNSTILSFPWVLGDILSAARGEYRKVEKIVCEPVLSSWLDLLDFSLVKMYNISAMDGRQCRCITVTKNVICEWMATCNLSVTMRAARKACGKCFSRIFNYFVHTNETECCSWNEDFCCCQSSCSPSRFIMDFMKFYMSRNTKLGTCESSTCNGFFDSNLESAALHTYGSIAVTRNIKHLGLSLDSESILDHENVREGDPVRISVQSNLCELISDNKAVVREFLQSITGVQDVQIAIEKDFREEHCLLVSATGTAWQRWDLEGFVMDEKFDSSLKSHLENDRPALI